KARPATLVQRVSKWSRRHRTATFAAAGFVVMLLMFASALVADRWRQVRAGSAFVEESIQAAYNALASEDVEQAVQRVSEATAQVRASRLAATELAERAATLQAELDRYQKF